MATTPISLHDLKKSPPCQRGASYSASKFSRNKLWTKILHVVKGELRAGKGLMQPDKRSFHEASGSVSLFCSAQSLALSP